MEKPEHEFIKRLFQQEFARMVAVLSRRFGLHRLAMAEDVVSETFLLATENWTRHGLPPNPTAWLYAVARQQALELLRRHRTFDKLVPALAARQETALPPPEISFAPQYIEDSQLQMLFALCTPAIASEAQIGLALRILCGFGIEEIAEAFLSNKEAINKRLFRAREKLRSEKVRLEMPAAAELPARLDNVLHVIYLLFSEGYYSSTQNQTLRQDLCLEALRLGVLLTAHPATRQPKTYALLALMCFHASRFGARQAAAPGPGRYEEQDEALWDQALINQGQHFLRLSAQGSELSSYHLEARIASWHCQRADSPEKWEAILQLYNQLLLINYSPGVALSRTFALYKANGRPAALAEAEKLRLEHSLAYFLLLGELYQTVDDAQAQAHFARALTLARTPAEQQYVAGRLQQLRAG